MDQQCHCEGAVGDCGNLNPYDTKTVYFLRRPGRVGLAPPSFVRRAKAHPTKLWQSQPLRYENRLFS